MLIEAILSALVPVGIEGLKRYIDKKTEVVVPQSVDDQVKLFNAETDRLKAVGELDNPYGTPSQWVIDLRASSRYIAALGVIVSCVPVLYTPNLTPEAYELAMDAVSVVFGFLFGWRIVANRGK